MDWILNLILLSALCSLSSCVLQPEFVLFKEKKTWREAQSFCREDCLDLATIEDLGDIETVLRSVEGQYDDAKILVSTVFNNGTLFVRECTTTQRSICFDGGKQGRDQHVHVANARMDCCSRPLQTILHRPGQCEE
ncbi:hypothetical protein KUCAC02_032046 [Chaenocephalus aceratus]|nr:hypothetical protein KUCAC02_032046 [Chaenocephalus aceratus]